MGQHQSTWHKDVGALMVQHRAAPGNVLELPLPQLQEITSSYLRKTRNPTGRKRELHLNELYTQHPEKDVALAACARELPSLLVRRLLRDELQSRLSGGLDVQRYLWTIMAVNRANPTTVTNVEAKCAYTLLQLSNLDILTVGGHLQTLGICLAEKVPQDIVFCPLVRQIPLNACRSFATELETLKVENRWRRARDATVWLSDIAGAYPAVEQILNIEYRHWQAWAAWRPNSNRLEQWEQLTTQQRQELQDILALEGPDFSLGEPTLREGLKPKADREHGFSVGYGQVLAKLSNLTQTEARRMLDEVLNMLDDICRRAPSALNLYTDICVHRVIDDEVLGILRKVIATRDPSVSAGVLALLSTSENGLRMNNIKKLLPALNGPKCKGLRNSLAPQIVKIVEESMLRLQDKFCQCLADGHKADGVARKLHSLGNHLQGASWIYPMLTEQLGSVLNQWPTTEDIDALFELRSEAHGIALEGTSALVDIIDEYYTWRLTGRGGNDEEAKGQVEGLVDLWKQTRDVDLHAAALSIADRSNIPIAIRRQCLGQLCNMGEEFVREVVMIVKKENDTSCVNFTHLLMSKTLTDSARSCWRNLLMWMIEKHKHTLLDYTLSQFNMKSWLGWVENVRNLFPDKLQTSSSAPPILHHALHSWTTRLTEIYFDVLTTLEESIGSGAIMRWILTGWEESGTIEPMLNVLRAPNQDHCRPIVQRFLAGISPDGSNVRTVFETINLITKTSQSGIDICIRVLELQRKWGTELAEGLLAAWLQASEISAADKRALEAAASILGLKAHTSISIPGTKRKLQVALEYLNQECSSIIGEAQRLDNLRLALKSHDAIKTSNFLIKIGMNDPSVLEDATASVPASLADVVERIGDGEFEMAFPLTSLRPLQRVALGVGNARMLLVRLYLAEGGRSPEFCIHLHPEVPGSKPSRFDNRFTSKKAGGHQSWQASCSGSAPDIEFCGGRTNRAIYQLGRHLWVHLVSGDNSLEGTHKFLTGALNTLSSWCIVCGSSLGTKVLRSTTCQKACSVILRKSSLEVRLSDVRHDPGVVDLLLTGVYAVANQGASQANRLLPRCPLAMPALLAAINLLPAPSVLQANLDLTKSLRGLGRNTELLLSWICTDHRGFVASATGVLKIPSMPGVHQFVLASASPEREKAFAAHMSAPSSGIVVFHGTSLDRLYAIIRDGLRVMSAGPLQRNGASHGTGVYVAVEPTTSWSFATPTAPGFGWHSSALKDTRVLLGCEYARPGTQAWPGVYVVQDHTQLMVRYIFMCPPTTQLPIAAHVVPAMMSAYNSMRNGLV